MRLLKICETEVFCSSVMCGCSTKVSKIKGWKLRETLKFKRTPSHLSGGCFPPRPPRPPWDQRTKVDCIMTTTTGSVTLNQIINSFLLYWSTRKSSVREIGFQKIQNLKNWKSLKSERNKDKKHKNYNIWNTKRYNHNHNPILVKKKKLAYFFYIDLQGQYRSLLILSERKTWYCCCRNHQINLVIGWCFLPSVVATVGKTNKQTNKNSPSFLLVSLFAHLQPLSLFRVPAVLPSY